MNLYHYIISLIIVIEQFSFIICENDEKENNFNSSTSTNNKVKTFHKDLEELELSSGGEAILNSSLNCSNSSGSPQITPIYFINKGKYVPWNLIHQFLRPIADKFQRIHKIIFEDSNSFNKCDPKNPLKMMGKFFWDKQNCPQQSYASLYVSYYANHIIPLNNSLHK